MFINRFRIIEDVQDTKHVEITLYCDSMHFDHWFVAHGNSRVAALNDLVQRLGPEFGPAIGTCEIDVGQIGIVFKQHNKQIGFIGENTPVDDIINVFNEFYGAP